MGGKIVLTYKRKRSKSDNPVFVKSKMSSNFCSHEKSRDNAEFEVAQIKVGEHVPSCEDRNSIEFSKDPEKERADSSCAKIQDSSVSDNTKESVTLMLENESLHVAKLVNYQDVNFKENHGKKSRINSSGQSVNEEKAIDDVLECDDNTVKTVSVSNVTCMRTSDEVNRNNDKDDLSILEMSDSEDPSKCCEEGSSCLCCSTVTKPRFTSSLITFYRKSKRKLYVTPPAPTNCKNEKISNSTISFNKLGNFDCSSFHTPESTIATVIQQDNALPVARELADDAPSSDQPSNREASPFKVNACNEIQASDIRSQNASLEHLNTSRIASDDDTETSFHQFITAPACRDIDCNRPLDSDSDEKDLPISLKVLHYPPGSIDTKINGNGSMLQCGENRSSLTTTCDKGKRPIDPFSSFAKCKSLELFPENISAEKPQSTNETINGAPKERWFCPKSAASVQIPFFRSFPFSNDAYYTPICSGFLPSTSSRDQYPSSRENMFISNDGLSRFSSQNLWLDEELDSLWIGIRRHGRLRYESILTDPRLHFLPWRTPRDLAYKWQEEQLKLLYSPEELSKANLNNLMLQKSRQLQKPVSEGTNIQYNESYEANSASIKRLPHWLRKAKELTVVPAPVHGIGSSVSHYGSWLLNQDNLLGKVEARDNRCNGEISDLADPSLVMLRKSEQDECIVNDQDEKIIVRSDASSEETISDDHNIGS